MFSVTISRYRKTQSKALYVRKSGDLFVTVLQGAQRNTGIRGSEKGYLLHVLLKPNTNNKFSVNALTVGQKFR